MAITLKKMKKRFKGHFICMIYKNKEKISDWKLKAGTFKTSLLTGQVRIQYM